ncbi:MAG: PQQ-binding-like beta-propeller repeat protein [Vicinamibacterales bacterium]
MRTQRLMIVGTAGVLAGSFAFAQVGRGGSQWLTALGDAQRTSWVRSDDKISVATLSKPGFELQWNVKVDNKPRGVHGLGQGVTASGVTLFVPMSVVSGSSNNVYAIDNDIGYVVWERQFDVVLPAPTDGCPGGITAGATRLVRLDGTVASSPGFGGRRGAVGYRSLVGEPGQGVPVEGRAAGPAARGGGRGAAGAAPAAPPQVPGARGGQAADRIPGSPRRDEGAAGAFGFLSRPSGVVYVVTSDGMLHVLGLASGKDIQRPAPFLPANARWSPPIAVDTMLYAATSGGCGGAPHGIWALDLDSETKPVTSWKTNGGPVVGAVAFASDGTLVAAIGAGQTTGDGKANAIVALDPKTLQVKDWFTHPSAEFVTGPTILRHNDKEIVAAATKDGRILLLESNALGGRDHATPLHASRTWLASSATVSADALATWQQSASWILLPVAGRIASGAPSTNGPISTGAVMALKLTATGDSLSLEPGWVSHNLSTPATPIIVNGVVFTLATGLPAAAAGRGTPAVLHAYDGATGKRLWSSEKAMTTFASPRSLWTGLGQIYVGAHDGTIYAFGFNDERRHTNER